MELLKRATIPMTAALALTAIFLCIYFNDLILRRKIKRWSSNYTMLFLMQLGFHSELGETKAVKYWRDNLHFSDLEAREILNQSAATYFEILASCTAIFVIAAIILSS